MENRKGRAMAIEDASFQPWERIVNQEPSLVYGDEDFSIQVCGFAATVHEGNWRFKRGRITQGLFRCGKLRM
jgi:hypothetical protein